MKIDFAVSFRSRMELGPCLGITFLQSEGEGDFNELCIDLVVFSIIFLWV